MNPDEAFSQVHDALLRITSQQQGRLESPDFPTDWAYDWKQGKSSGLWYFDWMLWIMALPLAVLHPHSMPDGM
jgi:hypothetical protein